jgi:hypothetical protein
LRKKLGFHTTGGQNAQGSKMVLYSNMRQAHNQDMLHINSWLTALEMGVFAENNGKLEAIPPNHDDTVTECALMCEGVRQQENAIAPRRVEVAAPKVSEFGDDDIEELPKKIERKPRGRVAQLVAREMELVGANATGSTAGGEEHDWY